MPRDYDLHGLKYDGRVVAAQAWYLQHQHEVNLLPDDLRTECERDLRELSGIFEGRAQRLHEPVRWRAIDRLVCTCSLVVRTDARFETPVGHLDPIRWEPVRTVVVRSQSDGGHLAACQICGTRSPVGGPVEGHDWCARHSCPAEREADETVPAGIREVHGLPGETFDDTVHWMQVLDRANRYGTAGF